MLESAPVIRFLAAVASLAVLSAPAGPVQAVDYNFLSVYSRAAALPEVTVTSPSVNSTGTIAFAALVFDPATNRSVSVVFRGDGVQLVRVLSLTDALGDGSPGSLVINDAGAIAVNYVSVAGAVIAWINVDGPFSLLARADQLGVAP